jgi:hypothetical protein
MVGPASIPGRLARTRAAVKKHPKYSEHGYFVAVETAWSGNSMQRLSLERCVPTPRSRVWSPQLLACVLERLESDGWEIVQQPKLTQRYELGSLPKELNASRRCDRSWRCWTLLQLTTVQMGAGLTK